MFQRACVHRFPPPKDLESSKHGIVYLTIAKRKWHMLSFPDCNGSTVPGQKRGCCEAKTVIQPYFADT